MPEALFEQFLVIGWLQPNPIFEWRVWKGIAALLDPVFEAARKPSSIRMYQETRIGEKDVRLGRLNWSAKSHQKWTHGSSVTGSESEAWRFLGAEFWAPTPGKLKDDEWPDVFMNIWCDEQAVPEHPLKYDLSLHLLVSKELPASIWREAAPKAITEIAKLSRAMICATREGPWHAHDDPGWMTGIGPMEYISTGIPRWVEKSPELADFPPAANWRALAS